jgi:hypothetical protein
VRWPGLVPPRSEINEIFSAEDWATTPVAAAGEPNIKDKLLVGYDAAGKNFRVHLDGYDQRDLLSGKGPDKRREFFYWTDDGNLAGLRYDRLSNTLTVPEVRRLFRAVIEVMHEAIGARGSSLADEQYVDLSGKPGSYQLQHQVYGREGKACLRCRATIERTKWGGRSTFYCPECQV